jgi:hypothetical protein
VATGSDAGDEEKKRIVVYKGNIRHLTTSCPRILSSSSPLLHTILEVRLVRLPALRDIDFGDLWFRDACVIVPVVAVKSIESEATSK